MNEQVIAIVESPATVEVVTHGPHGHVLCRQCGREVLEISKEVGPDWAYCVHHRPNHEQEDSMSKKLSDEVKAENKKKRDDAKAEQKAAKQVSIAKAKELKKAAALKAKEAKKAKVAKKQDKAPEITLKAKTFKTANGTLRVPQRGNMATFLEAIKCAGGLTREQIHEQAKSFGLGGKSWQHACNYASKLKLLKEAQA